MRQSSSVLTRAELNKEFANLSATLRESADVRFGIEVRAASAIGDWIALKKCKAKASSPAAQILVAELLNRALQWGIKCVVR